MERKIAKKKLSQNFSGRLTPKIGRVTSFSRNATVATSGQNKPIYWQENRRIVTDNNGQLNFNMVKLISFISFLDALVRRF